MRLIILIFILFFVGNIHAQSQLIEIPAGEYSMNEIIKKLEGDYQFFCSFKESDIESLRVTVSSQKLSAKDFLEEILAKTDLKAEILEEHYIIFSAKGAEDVLTEDLKKDKNYKQFCGKVFDELGLPMPAANVYLSPSIQGTYTDNNGNFDFQAVIEKQDTFFISFVGYEDIKIPVEQFIFQPCQDYKLKLPTDFQAKIIVKEYLTDGITLSQSGASVDLKPKQFGSLPGQAEPEILDAITFLPGITSPDGSVDNICIRGGTPDQNLILWEHIPVYHAAHYFGMISAFNPYIIDDISVFRSGFDANYGGRIAGVIDLKSQPNFTRKKPFVDAGANFLNVYANGKFSFLKNRASLIFSTRRSISELWRSPIFNNITNRIHQGVVLQIPLKNGIPDSVAIQDNFHFFDTNLKAAFRVSKRDEVSAAYFFGESGFESTVIDNKKDKTSSDTVNVKNYGVSLRWKHDWTSNFSSSVIGLISDYQLKYNYEILLENENRRDKTGLKESNIREEQIQLLNEWKGNYNSLKFGYQYINYNVNYQILRTNRQTPQSNEMGRGNASLQVLHADYKQEFLQKFGMNLGLRYSNFDKSDKSFFEPRFRLWYQPNQHFNLHFSAGKYQQFLSRLVEIEGDKVGIEMPIWVLSGQENIPVLTANQQQIGFVFQKKGWLLDAQVYKKKVKGVTSFATGFTGDLNNGFHVGDSEVRGLDILLKKRWKKFRSWVSYSLSKNDFLFRSFFDRNFAAPIDQRHILNWANSISFGNFEFSIGWRASTGLPYSLRENYRVLEEMDGAENKETIEPIIPEFNDQNLDFNHQADVTISYEIKSVKKGAPNWYFGLSLANIYNQTNLYSRSFFVDKKKSENSKLIYVNRADLGFTPNFAVRMSW